MIVLLDLEIVDLEIVELRRLTARLEVVGYLLVVSYRGSSLLALFRCVVACTSFLSGLQNRSAWLDFPLSWGSPSCHSSFITLSNVELLLNINHWGARCISRFNVPKRV